jgi:N utilization substance protein B
MPSRREIREAVVQFLYCYDLEGGADPGALRDTFWDFITESDRHVLHGAIVRTVKHLAHGREERIQNLETRVPKALATLAAWPEAEPLAAGLRRISALETEWTSTLERVEREAKAPDPASPVPLASALDRLFLIDRTLEEARIRFFRDIEDFPALRGPLEPVAASVRRLQRISERMRMIENPEQFPEQSDLAKIRECKSSLRELRTRADEMVNQLLAARESIDASLARTVENFSPERIDPVDRAILRLACYEMVHAGTPAKVAINEAIELARRFGTTDSSRFVNGVLDRIARDLV